MSEITTTKRGVPQRLVAPFAGVTSLLILVQGITAGQFIAADTDDKLVAIHGMFAYLTVLFAVATAVIGVVAFRKSSKALLWGSISLGIVVLGLEVVGKAITDGKMDYLIPVHIPFALIAFGLTVWVAVGAAAQRRSA